MAQSGDGEKPGFCQRLGQQCSSFGSFLYNSENKQVMGRSGSSWAKIGFFYLVFYGFLAGFFSAMLAVFMTTIEKPEEGGKPKLTQFIANQPGLTLVGPYGDLDNYDSSSNSSNYAEKLIDVFKGIKSNKAYKGECPVAKADNVTKPCYAPFSEYGPCQPDNSNIDKSMFGLPEKKPCVFVRVNKVFGWNPSGDKSTNGNYLKLKCSAGGTTYPEGFLLNGFPFKGGKYELPFVAVQLDATDKDKKVKVDCVLEGKDIEISDSFNVARSYGKIRITDVSAKQ